jgi:hypothetical protein
MNDAEFEIGSHLYPDHHFLVIPYLRIQARFVRLVILLSKQQDNRLTPVFCDSLLGLSHIEHVHHVEIMVRLKEIVESWPEQLKFLMARF